MNLDYATKIGQEVLTAIKPFCLRAELAGSIRRQKPGDIKDVEICAIPDPSFMVELKGVVNIRWGKPDIGAFPSKYTKIRSVYPIDLFWATKQNWGLLFFIRTGCARFSESGLAAWKRISNGGYSENCQLHQADGTIVPTLEEADVFRAFNMRVIPPKERI